jgi:hypothetical protein
MGATREVSTRKAIKPVTPVTKGVSNAYKVRQVVREVWMYKVFSVVEERTEVDFGRPTSVVPEFDFLDPSVVDSSLYIVFGNR